MEMEKRSKLQCETGPCIVDPTDGRFINLGDRGEVCKTLDAAVDSLYNRYLSYKLYLY